MPQASESVMASNLAAFGTAHAAVDAVCAAVVLSLFGVNPLSPDAVVLVIAYNIFAFALAELQVLRGDKNLAKGAKVLALDSIETGAWSKINLTDGVLTTVSPAESDAVK